MLRDRVPLRGGLALICLGVLLVLSLLCPARAMAFVGLPIAYLLLWLGAVLPAQRIGRRNDISYGVYIYGFIVEQLVSLYGGNDYGQVVYIALAIAFTVPLAAASWFLVERPAIGRRTPEPAKVRVPMPTRPQEVPLVG
jgi:peptidoglycan/LPS O-acetylase OafA/YrhL